MNKIRNYQEIEKIMGGRSPEEITIIDNFFMELDKRINLSIYDREELMSHYFDAFEYYLDNGKSIKEIVELLDFKNIGDFYKEKKRDVYRLDNAANIYTLSMRYGYMLMFRLSVDLKENVVPSILQMALDFTLKRFPTFSSTIKNGVFWHYMETTNIPIKVEEEKEIPCRPISLLLRGNKYFRVLYYKNRISVELFHAMTDGTGGMVFLKSLLREYFILLGKDVSVNNGTLDINDEIKEEELVDEYLNNESQEAGGSLLSKKSLQLNGKLKNVNPYEIIHFVLDSNKLKEVSKKYNATVTSYLLALMFLASKKCIKKDKGYFCIQVPINVRKFLNLKTLRNFSLYINVGLNIEDINDKESLIKEMQSYIKEYGTEKEINKNIYESNRIIKRLAYVPLIIKLLVIKNAFDYVISNNVGLGLSNLGVIEVPEEIKDDIDHFDFIYLPAKPNRLTVSLITYKNQSRLSIIKASDEEMFEEELYRLLKEDGFDISLEGSIKYGN